MGPSPCSWMRLLVHRSNTDPCFQNILKTTVHLLFQNRHESGLSKNRRLVRDETYQHIEHAWVQQPSKTRPKASFNEQIPKSSAGRIAVSPLL